MLVEFWNWLLEADRLIVVGYSFGDEHINTLVEDWIESREGAILEVVDPGVPNSRFDCSGSTPYFIRAALEYKNHESTGCPGYPPGWRSAGPNFEFHRVKAAEWLESRS